MDYKTIDAYFLYATKPKYVPTYWSFQPYFQKSSIRSLIAQDEATINGFLPVRWYFENKIK